MQSSLLRNVGLSVFWTGVPPSCTVNPAVAGNRQIKGGASQRRCL